MSAPEPEAPAQNRAAPAARRGEPRGRAESEESDEVWGFRDTGFRINERGHVELTGSRYPLSGQELPDLLPFMRRTLDVPLDPVPVHPSAYPPPVPEPVSNPAFLAELEKFLPADAISSDPRVRLRHGHGHTQAEMYSVKYGSLARVPDLVLFPQDEAHVEQIVQAAQQHGACVIPFGGGTSVTEALRCPAGERRTIASIDLRRLDQIVWIDSHNHMACIQAGAVGRRIQAQLAEDGFALGHEPDSLEHSTLGGWIATNASGMKKNRYGNIEDLVLDVDVVTAGGRLQRSAVLPRESTGLDPRRWIFGSEGNLGIVTRAVVKIFPRPERQVYGSALLPDFERGVEFLYELAHGGALPASVRLMDNLQFQFGQALRPRASRGAALRRRAERFAITRMLGFDPTRMAACTFLFEGRREEVAEQQRRVSRLLRRHRGLRTGAANGERGYQLTFSIAYIRDFVMRHFVLGESFETSVPWSKIVSLCKNVEQRVEREHRARRLPGRPMITARVTQCYSTGACVYFYLAFYHEGVAQPSEVYAEIEHAARDEVLRSGGALSHHHGVGKLRQSFLPQIMSETALEWIAQLKDAVDPDNTFGAGNLLRP